MSPSASVWFQLKRFLWKDKCSLFLSLLAGPCLLYTQTAKLATVQVLMVLMGKMLTDICLFS